VTHPTDPAPGSGAAHEEPGRPSTAGPAPGAPVSPGDQGASLVAAQQRRDRLLDELDRTKDLLRIRTKELGQAEAHLAAAHGTVGYRTERALRRSLRGALKPAWESVKNRGRPASGQVSVVIDQDQGDPVADRPGTYRARMADRLSGTFAIDRRPVRMAIVGPAADASQVAAQLISTGIEATIVGEAVAADPEREIDIVLVVQATAGIDSWPRRIVRVAWLADDPDPWLDLVHFNELDLVLVADNETRSVVEGHAAKSATVVPDPSTPAGATALRAALLEWLAAQHVAIHISPPTWEAAASWGDTPFGRDIQKAFERRGWPATLHVFAERDSAPAIRADLAVHLLGVRTPAVRAGQTSVLWIISHPDLVRPGTCRPYDLIGVGSDPFLGYLKDWLGPNGPALIPLHQATDPDRFFPEPGGPAHEVLFVGSARPVRRPFLDALAGTSHDLAVYGRNWTPQLLEPRFLRGEWISNRDLHRYYASAAIVLSDSWADMRDEGFIPNRIYDALASGAFVISEAIASLDPEFDGSVVTYRDDAELPALIDQYLADPDERADRAEKGRRAVLARHTFGHRVDSIIRGVEALR
jgi:Glycosyl transferases group 1